MGTGDYVCITVRGRAPWGFRLRQSDAEPHHPLQVYQVENGSHASLAGLCENDELVSVNGEPCSTLSLSEADALIQASADCLQLLVKRCCSHPQERYTSVSPTIRIPSPYRHEDSREIYVSESQDEAYYGETDSEADCPGGAPMVRTQICIPPHKDRIGSDSQDPAGGDPKLEITPGSMVELQLSLSKTSLEDSCCTSLGCARGVEGVFHRKTNNENDDYGTPGAPSFSLYIPRHDRKPLAQRGVLVSSPSVLLEQVDVAAQASGRGSCTERVGVCGPEEGTSERLESTEGEGGWTEDVPCSAVSFGVAAEEENSESESEHTKPNKHRARHARLRRSESLSEKQVKEAKSKCKRIALLLTAAAPNPNNKGLLMFKKHRQRAKQYTLVSYGTGESEPEFDDEETDEGIRETHAVEVTVLATSEAELDEDFFTNPAGHRSIVTFDWDTGLLEIERTINSQKDMNTLPETKGKGALMFAERRQRIDEIAAEHEEMRRKGIPVEGVQEAENHYQQVEQQSYIQATESQNYMDVNVHHQQQHQHYQQYQEQYYQQQQQQQQQYQEYQQQVQYQQQQEYQKQQQYQQYQQLQQMQQSSQHLNGMNSHQTTVTQSSVMNRSAKPFSVENRAAAPFTPSANQEQTCYSEGQGEQIASRDERISVPAIKTGVLQDQRRNKAKPMFTFKEPPKVSPNPALLNLLNRSDKKAGFESCPEEDYLSLGAEACNFLQSPKTKHKIPPPVAPKPHLNPASPPWSPQPETASQHFPQHAENNVTATAGAPGPEADPAPNIESSAIPEQEPSPAPAPERQEALTKPPSQEQQETVNAWGTSEPQMQPDQQPETWSENQSQRQINNPTQPPQVHGKPEPPVSSWGPSPIQAHQQPPVSAWGPSQVQSQPLAQSQMQPVWVKQPQVISDVQPSKMIQTTSQSQPPWVTQSPPLPQTQPQPQPQISSWSTAPTQSPPQPPWVQSQMTTQAPVSTWSQDLNQTQGQPPWAQQQQPQPLQPWTGSQQSPQNPWAQPQSQSQPQPPWVSQNQQQALSQPPVSSWTQPQSPVQAQPPWVQQAPAPPQSSSQMQQPQCPWPPQSQWAQQPQEHPQQIMNSWEPERNQIQPAWAQPQLPAQTLPSWSQQPQQQAQPPSQTQTLLSAWTPRPQQGPVSISAPNETQKLPQPGKPWSTPQNTQPTSPQRMNLYTPGTKLPSPTPMSNTASLSGMGSAFEMPALRGKGAELFAKRQSRMEKYVVDSASVQANKARPPSPSPSLPTSWKYSTTCRAPPPLTYNPIQSPSYPPGAIKQPPSSSPSLKKGKGKEKDKPAPKPLHVLDVMKHQPYQLNASLFTYGPAAEKLAAEKEAAEKLAAQKAAEAQSQAQTQDHIQAGCPASQNQHLRYDQAPAPYGFMPQHAQPPQQHYGMSSLSIALHDGPYQHIPPNNYQPPPNPYQQAPYQQMYSPQQVYQQPPSSSYQQASSSPYQQPPPYEAGPNSPYSAVPTPCYQPVSSSYVVPAFPVEARADSASGSSILTAPKPKFSANKNAAQVWKPSPAEHIEK